MNDIVYLSGPELLTLNGRWYTQVEAITRQEVHLLPKTRHELEPAARCRELVPQCSLRHLAGQELVGFHVSS